MMSTKKSFVFDMETHDPDDYLTLLLLLGHPAVQLKAITVTPGSAYQVGLVRRTLKLFEKGDLPIGSYNIEHPKTCVSSWHEKVYGEIVPDSDALPGGELLANICDESTTLITGGPPKNLGAALQHDQFRLGRWVAQGGFAGEGVVPREKQLPKFKGMRTAPTFNLNGAPQQVLAALKDSRIEQRYFVSKNVCHRVIYDCEFHELIRPHVEKSLSLKMIFDGMESYLKKKMESRKTKKIVDDTFTGDVFLVQENGNDLSKTSVEELMQRAEHTGLTPFVVGKNELPVVRLMLADVSNSNSNSEQTPIGKKMHDPLAACCAIDSSIGDWREVHLFRERGKWGTELATGTNTHILIDYNHKKFIETFLGIVFWGEFE